MKITRKILEIDEERCNGCGQCILDCAENALAIVDGKAKIISDNLCDGLGACLQGCPQDALKIVEREAMPFDEEAVHTLQKGQGQAIQHINNTVSKCISSQVIGGTNAVAWPVKLRLVPANASFLQGANVLLVADCAPAVSQDFHNKYSNYIKLLCCPKFEDHEEIAKKIAQILMGNNIKSLETLRMEVPCCNGLKQISDKVSNMLRERGQSSISVEGHAICDRSGLIHN